MKAHLKVNNCRNEKHMCVLLKPYDAISEAVEDLAHHKHAQILVSTATTCLIQPKGLNKLHITMVAQFERIL